MHPYKDVSIYFGCIDIENNILKSILLNVSNSQGSIATNLHSRRLKKKRSLLDHHKKSEPFWSKAPTVHIDMSRLILVFYGKFLK